MYLISKYKMCWIQVVLDTFGLSMTFISADVELAQETQVLTEPGFGHGGEYV